MDVWSYKNKKVTFSLISTEILQGEVQSGKGEIKFHEHENAAGGGARHRGQQEPEQRKWQHLFVHHSWSVS